METFRTGVVPDHLPFSISYSDSLFFAGSCFAVEMAGRMARAGFSVRVNPHGIIFDPLSLARSLVEVLSGRQYASSDLFPFSGKWYSLSHHGSFQAGNPDELLGLINREITEARESLKKARVLFITFGTAEAYFHVESGLHAANCHKLPQAQFREVLIDHSQIVGAWEPVLPALKQFNPALQVVFTVSPVRYLRLGAVRNQVSKSHLLLAAHELSANYPDTAYFPSYEIVMDDLRDYRFYAQDRSHPSEEATEYIWLRLMEAMAGELIISTACSVRKDLRILDHRPSGEAEYRQEAGRFIEKAIDKLRNAGHPDPDIVKKLFY